MDFLRAFLLGVIQALTEFLPISSSAHLILFREWLGFDALDGLTFDVALHIGTVLALIFYFNRDLRRLAGGFVKSLRQPDLRTDTAQRLAWFIIIGTIPAAVLGALFADMIEQVFRNPPVIVVTLVVGGVLFIVVERVCRPQGDVDSVTLRTSLLIGLAQSLALIPGVSRSGITIVAGMGLNLRRSEAARFSFLLSVPIMIGAGTKKALELGQLSLSTEGVLLLLTGTITSAVAGWIVIKYLLKFLQNHKLDVFGYYRFALAVAILLWLIA